MSRSMYSKPVQNPADKPINEFLAFGQEQLEQSLTERFEKIVRQYPHRIAVKMGEVAVTYAALNAMSNRVARAILAERSSDPEPIGLFFAAGVAQIAGVLGALKAGKFFVLLDPSFPTDRIAVILEDSQAQFLLADEQNISVARQAADNRCRVMEFESISDRVSAEDLELEISSQALAYIVYTSGSTGRPKGVVWNHLNELQSVMRRVYADHVCAQDRIAALSSGTANAVAGVFLTLLNGAALLTFDVKEMGVSRLVHWLQEERISVCQIASPLFRKLCEALTGEERFPDLRLLRLRSEAVYKTDVDLYKKHFSPTCLLANGLSSSETGPLMEYVINHDTEIASNEVPLGYAFEGIEILLLNDEGERVDYNEVGEIVVRSRYLSEGYWRRPDLTEAKFKLDPNGGQERLYLTGDLGLMRSDGCLLYKGRKDFRVKIRGYGVEIAEIEKFLVTHPAVREAVVVPRQHKSSETSLVAYFTFTGNSGPSVSELRSFLKEKLPDYMIPSVFVSLNSIPLTPHGKVDRRALPDPDNSRPELAPKFIGPRNSVEDRLARIWEAVLDVRPIGIHDDFFDLGGHSLLVAQLSARITTDFQVAFSARELFESPTIAGLASAIEAKQRRETKHPEDRDGCSALVHLQAGRGGKTIFCFPYASGFLDEYVHFTRLARLLGPEYSFYGLRAPGTDGVLQPPHHLEEMADDYATAIQTVQPHGPYFIIGDCGGCPEAYETSRQLRARGEEMALLVVMDDQGLRSSRRYLWRQLTGRLRHRIDLITQSWAWHHMKEKLEFHLREMQPLRGGERMRYLVGKLVRGRRIVSDLRRELASVSQPVILNRRSAKHARKAHYLARCRYRPRPYDGRVTLVVNEEWYEWHRRHDSEPTLGWARLAAGGVEVHKIPGNHLTYITQNIHVVAEVLEKCLRLAGKRNLEEPPDSPDPSSSRDCLSAASS
jgi:amino acid adenylation domain-containing protein